MRELMKEPLLERGVVAFKGLTVTHKLLQEGAPRVRALCTIAYKSNIALTSGGGTGVEAKLFVADVHLSHRRALGQSTRPTYAT